MCSYSEQCAMFSLACSGVHGWFLARLTAKIGEGLLTALVATEIDDVRCTVVRLFHSVTVLTLDSRVMISVGTL